MSISIRLNAIAAKSRAWFSASDKVDAAERLACGIPEVDALLEGGLPSKGLTEIFVSGARRGEVRMLLGAVSRAPSAVWVLPERGFEPFLPAFEALGIDISRELFVIPPSAEEAFDAAELALASGEARVVTAWLPALSPEQDRLRLRRLALAAETRGAALFAIRPSALACLAPQGSLRLLFMPQGAGKIRIRALKTNALLNSSREILLEQTKLLFGTRAAEPSLRKQSASAAKTLPSQPSLFPEFSEALPAI